MLLGAPLIATPAAAQQLAPIAPRVERAVLEPAAIAPTTLLRCPANHPLRPLLDEALRAVERSSWIRDYTAVLVRRQPGEGRATDYEYFALKVCTRPDSVYLRAIGSGHAAGGELIFTPDSHDGLAWAHSPAWGALASETLTLSPESPRFAAASLPAPGTLGCARMLLRAIATLDAETRYGECTASIMVGARIDGRRTTCLQVIHPVRRASFDCHIFRLYLDEESSLAVRLERYDWPREPGLEPALLEELTYTRLTLNPGLDPVDFDPANPAYAFP